ncbi:MAG: hypothetical protein KJI69_04490 [Patescibacteria group bacterium]|nr:hypothetical protein [Patescibacteria group bacterium]
MTIYKTFKHKKDANRLLEIHYDENPESPREWDAHNGIMVCCHNRYNLGDKQFEDAQILVEHINEIKPLVKLPLYLLDHSGITISTSDFNDKWDSGQVGFIYTTKEKLKKLGHKKIPTKKKLIEWLKSEVSVYDDYLRGNVFGYIEYKIDQCNLDHDHKEQIDSVWGFYGSDFDENGIFDGELDKKDWEEI